MHRIVESMFIILELCPRFWNRYVGGRPGLFPAGSQRDSCFTARYGPPACSDSLPIRCQTKNPTVFAVPSDPVRISDCWPGSIRSPTWGSVVACFSLFIGRRRLHMVFSGARVPSTTALRLPLLLLLAIHGGHADACGVSGALLLEMNGLTVHVAVCPWGGSKDAPTALLDQDSSTPR